MPANFEQYLRLEIAKLPNVGRVRPGFDARQQLDTTTVDEIIQYFQRFIRINYQQAVQGKVQFALDKDVARLRSQADIAVLRYDKSGARGKGADNFFELMGNPTPREQLVDQLEKLAEKVAQRWQAIVTPQPLAVGKHKGRVRPMRPGYSVGNQNAQLGSVNGAGTIGGFIHSRTGVYLLSNTHVLTADPFAANDASPICQPGPNDGGADVVADVTHHYQFQLGAQNVMDAAIAKLRQNVRYDPEYEGVGPLTGMRDPQVGETLTLVARTTGKTSAVVQEVNADQSVVNWLNPYGNPIDFTGVTVLKRAQGLFANLEGDSGGMWIGEDNKAVALNFGGGEASESALAIPIRRIIAYFQGLLNDNRAGLVGIDNATFWR